MSPDDIRWLAEGFRGASERALGEALDVLVWEDGYECSAHPDFIEILRCIRTFDSDPQPALNSNGYGLAQLEDWERCLAELREMGFTALASAVHGVGDQHDRFVRRRGAYHDLEVSARRFLDSGMSVWFEIHLNRENIGEFASIVRALQGLTDGQARLTSGVDGYFMNDRLRELESVRLREGDIAVDEALWQAAPRNGHATEGVLTERLSDPSAVEGLLTYCPAGRGPEGRRHGRLYVQPSFEVVEVLDARPPMHHGNVREAGFEAVWESVMALELPPMPEPAELVARYGDAGSDLLYPNCESIHMKLADRYWSGAV